MNHYRAVYLFLESIRNDKCKMIGDSILLTMQLENYIKQQELHSLVAIVEKFHSKANNRRMECKRKFNTIFKYDASKLTKTIVHGFMGNCELPWVVDMRDALLKISDINVFCADWKQGSQFPNYSQAAANTQIVGLMIAKFFNAVSGVVGSIGPKLHLIGFSLGAQVCGYAGSKIPNCSRISGLDPAGPVFRDLEVEFRLDKSDADFVDVIHTNSAYYLSGGLGLSDVCGHVDFYPFGGQNQMPCKSVFQEAFFWKDIGCSHSRAVRLYIESIKNKDCKMVGFPCVGGYNTFLLKGECFDTSKAFPLGLNTPRNANGELYLTTRIVAPFCGTQLKVNISVDIPYSVLGKYYSRELKITFYGDQGEVETFTISKGFTSNYAIVSIHSSFGTTERLKVDGLTITDANGPSSHWRLNTGDGCIKSGRSERLALDKKNVLT
ncbi:Pancreatic lipase-related protein 3 [Lepeophtheirus salmonis]|uniref:Pancreatic lipase-related protein 3 n=1 Tax=Lepeophtheirus salmonis TaxID=72036 RepID=A0A7R8CFS4_LEPSM|nr:Pancreatic lipase-related protein 3 [Lepeophtheirus salmonis]CAF2809230.1 Pancreatic lipase-related protein 3 [Lepeophtheirus salmonis]